MTHLNDWTNLNNLKNFDYSTKLNKLLVDGVKPENVIEFIHENIYTLIAEIPFFERTYLQINLRNNYIDYYQVMIFNSEEVEGWLKTVFPYTNAESVIYPFDFKSFYVGLIGRLYFGSNEEYKYWSGIGISNWWLGFYLLPKAELLEKGKKLIEYYDLLNLDVLYCNKNLSDKNKKVDWKLVKKVNQEQELTQEELAFHEQHRAFYDSKVNDLLSDIKDSTLSKSKINFLSDIIKDSTFSLLKSKINHHELSEAASNLLVLADKNDKKFPAYELQLLSKYFSFAEARVLNSIMSDGVQFILVDEYAVSKSINDEFLNYIIFQTAVGPIYDDRFGKRLQYKKGAISEKIIAYKKRYEEKYNPEIGDMWYKLCNESKNQATYVIIRKLLYELLELNNK